jgi:hypothetical protein
VSDVPSWLEDEARSFSDKIGDLLTRVLAGAPDMRVSVVGGKVRIRPDGQTVDDRGRESGGVPLLVRGQQLAWLRLNYSCRPDSVERYLAVDSSKVWVVSTKDRSPLFRFEFQYEATRVPHSHIHVHAERGSLTHLLTRTGHGRPHEMSALHLPTGGSRFRPNLEDVVQFLIVECGVDPVEGWKAAVDERRAEWRAIQTRAVARAMPAEAAYALRELGYSVTPPPDGEPDPGRKARFAW